MNQTIKKRIEEINNGIVPEGYEKTSFGIFPCDWEKSKTLKDIGKFGKGRGIPGNKLISEGVPCVGYGDIYMKYNYHIEKAQSFVDESTAAESQKISKGTLLFTATGETADEIGKCVCYNGNEDIYAGGDIITFIPYKVNSMFIAYQQYQNFALRQKASLGQGHSVVHIQKDRLGKLHIAYPKRDREQSRIAEILMQWDKAIELQEKLIEAYQKSKKYYLNKMFPKKGSNVPEIRFPGFTAPWEQRKLKQVATIQKGEQLSKAKLDSVGKYYVLNGGMGPSGFCDDYNTEPNTISISEGGNSCGYVALNIDRFWSGGHNYTLQNLRIDTEFLFQYLKGIETKIMALRVGSGLPNIQKTAIDGVDIIFPLEDEQKSIGQFLSMLSNLITLHKQKRDKLVAQRKAMQQYLLTGIVRV